VAANYTRQIEFKVNDRAIKQATDRLVRSLTNIERKIDIIAKGFGKLDAGLDKSIRSTKAVNTQLNNWEKGFARAAKAVKPITKPVERFLGDLKYVSRLGERIRHNFELTDKAIAGIARSGGLTHLRNLLTESVKAQDLLLVSNSGYMQSLNATRQIQGEINMELIARQRILDDLVRKEGITAGPGISGFKQSLSEQKAILDRMLSSQDGYLNQAKRVKDMERMITQEMKERERIMGKLITKQEFLAKLGRGVGNVAGRAARGFRPGGGVETRGMGLGVAAGVGGAGLGVNALSNWASQGMGAGGDPFAAAITKAASGMTLGTIKGSAFLSTLKAIGIALTKLNPQLLGIYAALYLAFGQRTNKVIGGTVSKLTTGMWGLTKSLSTQHAKYLILNTDLVGIDQKFQLSATAAKKFEIALNGVGAAKARLAKQRGVIGASGFRSWSEGADMSVPIQKSIDRHAKKIAKHTGQSAKIAASATQYSRPIGPQQAAAKAPFFKGGAGGAISSAMIGGGFPLLFGQGGASAVGGGIGGLAGGAIGGGFGFGLSIVGTALGQAYQKNLEFNKSLAVLNIRLKDTGDGSVISAREIDALAKKMNITKQEAMGVLSAFSQFDSKGVRMSLSNMFGQDSAAVDSIAQSRTQAALAEQIFAARTKIGNAQAESLLKQNLIADSATVELALAKAIALEEHKKTIEKAKQITFMDRILAAAASDLGAGKLVDPIVFAEKRVLKLQETFEKNKAKDAENFVKALEEIRTLLGLVKKGTAITEGLTKIDGFYKQIGKTVEDGVVSSIESAIKGTKTLGDVLNNVFNQLASQFLRFGVNQLLGSIPGIGKAFRADGGPVSGGSPYVVGEKGPELFVPNSSGNIVPNHAMGGSMVVNVDASGSSAEGDDDRSRQLGELIGAAVQSEIIRQQRPGGTLY